MKIFSKAYLFTSPSEGLKCFSTLPQKHFVSNTSRFKGNRVTDRSVEHSKEIKKDGKSTFNHSTMKPKDTHDIQSQYDELIIPNWTYSTDLGLVYNPIREKGMKITGRSLQKKTKSFNPNMNSPVKLNHITAVTNTA